MNERCNIIRKCLLDIIESDKYEVGNVDYNYISNDFGVIITSDEGRNKLTLTDFIDELRDELYDYGLKLVLAYMKSFTECKKRLLLNVWDSGYNDKDTLRCKNEC